MKKFFWVFVFTIFACQAHAECQLDNKTWKVTGKAWEVTGKDCPKDVGDIVERIYTCNHFGGEWDEDEDSERKEFILEQMSKFRCEALESEQKTIKQKYKDNLQILNFLKDSEELKGF